MTKDWSQKADGNYRVPIRSWSGGREYGNINSSAAFFNHHAHSSEDSFVSIIDNTCPHPRGGIHRGGENSDINTTSPYEGTSTRTSSDDYDISIDSHSVLAGCTDTIVYDAVCANTVSEGTDGMNAAFAVYGQHDQSNSDKTDAISTSVEKKESDETVGGGVHNNALEKAHYQRKQRGRHGKKLREYIDNLKENRDMKIIEREYAQERADETKRLVTKAVLSKMKAERSSRMFCKSDNAGTDKDVEITEKIIPAITDDKIGTLFNRVRTQEIQKKYLDQIAETQRLRKEKKLSVDKLKQRLDKRAYILRKKYDDKIPSTKLWEREQIKDSSPQQSKFEEESNATQRLALLPSQVEALAERLSKPYQGEQSSTTSCIRFSDFDRWKRQNGVLADQNVFSSEL